MNEYIPRQIKFKIWNPDARLLTRPDNIDCVKGELIRKNQILLQFTGLLDKEGDEIYDQDILLIGYDKFRIFWHAEKNAWYFSPLGKPENAEPFLPGVPAKMRRFCSWFEMEKS